MLITCALLLFFTLTINAQTLTGVWPPVDKPPYYKSEWDGLVDMSKVPNVPLATDAGQPNQKCLPTDPYCNWSCTECTRNDTDITICPNKTDWGLSFDDGPTIYTPTLLDYLDKLNLKVTFFVIGSRVFEHPETLKREVEAGHQIGVHTWSHSYLTNQTNQEIIAEIKWTELAIEAAVGIKPKYMRPPYGDVDDRVRKVIEQLGYKIVIWDDDTNDWMSGETPDTFDMSWVKGNFTKWVKAPSSTGHISLEHDLYNQTVAQAPSVVPIVKGAGFNIKPIYQCVGDTSYYVNSTTITQNATATQPTTTQQPTTTANQNVQGTATPASAPNSTASQSSNSISNINNNYYYSLSLVVFTLGYFIIII